MSKWFKHSTVDVNVHVLLMKSIVDVKGMAWPRQCFHLWSDSFSNLRWSLIYHLISNSQIYLACQSFSSRERFWVLRTYILGWYVVWSMEKFSILIWKYVNHLSELWFDPPKIMFFLAKVSKAYPLIDSSKLSVREVMGTNYYENTTKTMHEFGAIKIIYLRWRDRNKGCALCLPTNPNNFVISYSIALKLCHFIRNLLRNNTREYVAIMLVSFYLTFIQHHFFDKFAILTKLSTEISLAVRIQKPWTLWFDYDILIVGGPIR